MSALNMWKAPLLRALPLRWTSTNTSEPTATPAADVTKPATKTVAKKKSASASKKKKTSKKPASKKSKEPIAEVDELHAEPGEDAEEVAAQTADLAAGEISSALVEEGKATATDAAPSKKRVSPPKLAGTGSGGRVTKQDIQKTAEVFETYLRLATDTEGALRNFERRPPQIKALTYDTAIQLASRSNIVKAQQYYRDMLAAGLKPTAATLDHLIYSPDRRLTFDKGMFYYRDMLRQNLTPTDNTLHQLLELCSAHRRVSEATVFFEEMKRRWGVRPTKLNYQLLVDLLRKENRLQLALKYLHELEAAGFEPSDDAIVHMVVLCSRANLLPEALSLYQRYEDRDLPHPKLINLISMACGRLRRTEQLVQLYRRWRDKGGTPDFVMLNNIIDACAKSRQPDLAKEFLQEMRKLEYEPTEVTLSLMMRAYGPKHLKAAMGYYESMKKAGIAHANTFTSAMKICAQAGDYQRVLAIWSCAPTTTTFSTLIQACGKARLDTKLLEIYEQMKDYDLKPNDEVFASMIMAYGHLGNFEEALRYFFAVEQAGLQQNELTYAAIITAAGLCNNMDKALGFFQEMQVLEMKLGPVAYEAIIRAALRCYRADIATTYYQRMVSERIPPNTGLKGEIDAALSGQPRHGAGQAHVQPRSGGS